MLMRLTFAAAPTLAIVASAAATLLLSSSCKTTQDAHVAAADGFAASGSGKALAVQLRNGHGTWQGFGGSLSWWASTVGGTSYASTYADLLYTANDVSVLGKTVPGLNFNVVRYNIGGTGLPQDAAGEVYSPQMPGFRQIIGYWPITSAASTPEWHWERDANQRNMLQLAVQRGANQVEFFANAPMWWMSDSKSAAGGTLLPEHLDDFTHYLATVVDYAAHNWQVNVTSVAPFNEPSAVWWAYPKNQEGCSIPPPLQPKMLASLRQELDRLGYQNVAIAASDENSVQDALKTVKRNSPQTIAFSGNNVVVPSLINKTNVHGYIGGTSPQRDNKARSALRSAIGEESTWMSEYTDGDATGLTLATTIMQDLNYLQPTSWVYWQPVEPGNAWSFIYGDYNPGPTLGQPLQINTKYYVMALFSRALRPGQILFDSGDPNTLVAYDPGKKHLTIVAQTGPGPQSLSYDLSSFHTLPGAASLTTTTFDGTSLFSRTGVTVQGHQVTVAAATGGVYALEFDGIE